MKKGKMFATEADLCAAFITNHEARGMTPHCHNHPEPIGYTHSSGEFIPHRMSVSCKSWSTGDRATPVPVRENWNCAGCKWLPREDVMRFAQITDEAEVMARLVELAG